MTRNSRSVYQATGWGISKKSLAAHIWTHSGKVGRSVTFEKMAKITFLHKMSKFQDLFLKTSDHIGISKFYNMHSRKISYTFLLARFEKICNIFLQFLTVSNA